jgi:uncharacterized small protein (DUF1192 family)
MARSILLGWLLAMTASTQGRIGSPAPEIEMNQLLSVASLKLCVALLWSTVERNEADEIGFRYGLRDGRTLAPFSDLSIEGSHKSEPGCYDSQTDRRRTSSDPRPDAFSRAEVKTTNPVSFPCSNFAPHQQAATKVRKDESRQSHRSPRC